MRKMINFLLICIFVLLCSCAGKKIPLSPNIYILKEDNSGLMICRFDEDGGMICDRTLDYCDNEDMICWPKKKLR